MPVRVLKNPYRMVSQYPGTPYPYRIRTVQGVPRQVSGVSSHDRVCTDHPELCSRADNPCASETTGGNNIPAPNRSRKARTSTRSCSMESRSTGRLEPSSPTGSQAPLVLSPSLLLRSALQKAQSKMREREFRLV